MWEVGIGFLTGLMRRIHWVVHCLGGWQSRVETWSTLERYQACMIIAGGMRSSNLPGRDVSFSHCEQYISFDIARYCYHVP